MLDWIKRIKSPPPDLKVVEIEAQAPATEERLERLLVRLNTDRGDHGLESKTADPDSVALKDAAAESDLALDADAPPAVTSSGERFATSESGPALEPVAL